MRRLLGLLGILACGASTPALATTFAASVVSVTPGSGPTHPNFDAPLDILGVPDYADPSSTGFGIGAYSLGAAGSITAAMGLLFAGGGTAAPDLFLYEIGPTFGGSAESTLVEVSIDGVVWSAVGTASGGTSAIDLDAFGFGPSASLGFVRVTDTTFNAGQPAGPDIDAIEAVNTVPEPGTGALVIVGLAAAGRRVLVERRRRN